MAGSPAQNNTIQESMQGTGHSRRRQGGTVSRLFRVTAGVVLSTVLPFSPVGLSGAFAAGIPTVQVGPKEPALAPSLDLLGPLGLDTPREIAAADLASAIGTAEPGTLFLTPGNAPRALAEAGLVPLAVLLPPLNSSSFVLLARPGLERTSVKGKQLACRPLEPTSQAALETALKMSPLILTDQGGLDGLNRVEVGKGLDVLLALKGAQVDLGWLPEAEYQRATSVARHLTNGLELLGVSPLPLKILAARRADPEATATRTALETLLGKLAVAPPQADGTRWMVLVPRLPASSAPQTGAPGSGSERTGVEGRTP